ncbi:unnamed protein product, partial [Polarella glacialis]
LCQQLRQRTLEEEACLAVLGEAQAERRQRQSLECQQAESLQATLRAVAAEVRQLRHTAEEEEAESQERERGLEEMRRPRPRRSAMGLSRSAAGGPPVGPGPEGPEVKARLGRRSAEFAALRSSNSNSCSSNNHNNNSNNHNSNNSNNNHNSNNSNNHNNNNNHSNNNENNSNSNSNENNELAALRSSLGLRASRARAECAELSAEVAELS